MKKTSVLLLIMMAILCACLFSACDISDTPDAGVGNGQTDGENGSPDTGKEPNDGDNGDVSDGNDVGNDDSTAAPPSTEKKNYKFITGLSQVYFYPHEDAPEYYVFDSEIIKIFFSYEEVSAAVSMLSSKGAVLAAPVIAFNCETEDVRPIWILSDGQSYEDIEALEAENKHFDELNFNPEIAIRSALTLKDPEKQSCLPLCLQGFSEYPYSMDNRSAHIALVNFFPVFYRTIEADDFLASSVTLIPQNYNRELFSLNALSETSYEVKYDGKTSFQINTSIPLTEEQINALLDHLKIVYK